MANMNIVVDIVGKDVGAVSILDAVANKAEGLGGAVATAGKALAGLAVVGAGAVVAGMGAAVTAAAGFEQQMSEVKAVSGATGEEMGKLSGLALQLGKDTSFSASEAAAGIAELVKGGLTIPDIMNGAAEATLNLAAAGGIGLADAATIASGALNSFKLGGQDMAHVADLIAGAANASALDVGQFQQSLQAAGAVAATVGFTFDDLAQGVAVLGKHFITGSDAGTSLKTLMLNLNPSTKEATNAMRDLGIVGNNTAKEMAYLAKAGISTVGLSADDVDNKLLSLYAAENGITKITKGVVKDFEAWKNETGLISNAFFTAEGKVKSMSEVAGVLQNATKGLTEQQRLSTLQTIFGSDAIRAAAILADEGAAGFTEMAGAMGKVTAASVGAEKLNNVKGSLQQLQGSVETLSITFGTALLPVLKRGLDGATGFVNGLIPVADALGKQIVAGAEGGGAALSAFLDGDVLKAGAILKTAFNIDALPFLTGLDAIMKAVGSLMDGDLPKVAAIIGQAFGIDLTPFLGALSTAKDVVSGFVSDAVGNLQQLGGFLKQALGGDVTGAIQGVLGMIVDGKVKLADQLLEWGQAFLGWLLPQVPGLLAQLGTFLQSMLTWLGGAVVQVVEHFAPMAAAFIDWIGPQLPGLLRELGAFAAGMFEWLVGTALPAIREKLGQWAMAFIEWIGPRIGPMLLELGKLLLELTVWLGTTAIPAIQAEMQKWGAALTNWIKDAVLPFIGKELEKFGSFVWGWLGDRVNDAKEAAARLGDAIVRGVWSGMEALGGWLRGKLSEFLSLLPQWARDMLGIHSPSTVFAEEVGRPIVQGIIVGIVQEAPLLQQAIMRAIEPPKAVTEAYDALTRQIKDGLITGYEEWGKVTDGIFKSLSGDAWGLINLTQDLINRIAKIDFPSGPGGGGGGRPIDIGAPVPIGQLGQAARSLTLPAARAAGRGGDTIINLQVNGSVVSEKDLITTVWQGLQAKQRRDATLGFQ